MGCLILINHFPHKSPIISGSFAKIDLQLKASYGSSPPCTARTLDITTHLVEPGAKKFLEGLGIMGIQFRSVSW